MMNYSKYVNDIHNLFITIVLIYIDTLIIYSYFFFHSKLNWKRAKVLRSDKIKPIQEVLEGFIIEQIVDRKGWYYNNGKLDPRLPEELD
jgi:hypothetical protein